VVLYLCFKFRIFNRFILKEYIFQIDEGFIFFNHVFVQLKITFLLYLKKCIFFFESLTIIGILSLRAFLMNIHHDTSFRFILEEDFIFLTFKICNRSCLNKGARLWLIARSYICSFCITHFIFTSTLCFRLGSIQPSTFSLFTCEYDHELDASSTHLTDCSFESQQIITHDAIRNVIYVFTQNNGHDIWKEQWYAFTLGVSLRADFYMVHED